MKASLHDLLTSHLSSLSLKAQRENPLEHWVNFFNFSFFRVKPNNLAFLLNHILFGIESMSFLLSLAQSIAMLSLELLLMFLYPLYMNQVLKC